MQQKAMLEAQALALRSNAASHGLTPGREGQLVRQLARKREEVAALLGLHVSAGRPAPRCCMSVAPHGPGAAPRPHSRPVYWLSLLVLRCEVAACPLHHACTCGLTSPTRARCRKSGTPCGHACHEAAQRCPTCWRCVLPRCLLLLQGQQLDLSLFSGSSAFTITVRGQFQVACRVAGGSCELAASPLGSGIQCMDPSITAAIGACAACCVFAHHHAWIAQTHAVAPHVAMLHDYMQTCQCIRPPPHCPMHARSRPARPMYAP